jgi:hypothetical protein
MDDFSVHTWYVAHTEDDTCHDEVNMMTWQHRKLSRVTHFWIFLVGMWTNGKVPCGSPYSHVAVHTTTWHTVQDMEDTWHLYNHLADDMAS